MGGRPFLIQHSKFVCPLVSRPEDACPSLAWAGLAGRPKPVLFAFSLSILISLFCWSFSVYKRRNVECVANESKLIFFCFSSSSLFFFGYKEKMCFFFFYTMKETDDLLQFS